MSEKRPRVSWKQDCVDKSFLEACINEITNNGREGTSLKATSWKVVSEKLKNEHNFVVDQKQMKNRYDYLKAKYTAWSKLKNKTGNVYNPITNTFNMTEDEWQAEMKSNKYVEKLRYAPLLYPDLCTQLFDGATSTGFHGWGPSSAHPNVVEDVSAHDSGNQNTQMETRISQEPRGTSEESSSHSNNKKTKRKGKDKEAGGNIIDSNLLKEVGEAIMNVAKSLLEKQTPDDDIGACMEKLEKLEWEESDARYETTLLLFGESSDLRKVWLRLKPSSCESWVRNAGRKYGLLG